MISEVKSEHNQSWKFTQSHTCAPQPMPKDEIADGGDQDPSSLRAITNPVPTLYVTIKPTLATVKIARPLACFRIAPGMGFSGVKHPTCNIDRGKSLHKKTPFRPS